MGELSKQTLKNAGEFSKMAREAEINIGDGKISRGDFIFFMLTNGAKSLIIYCTPNGYLLESLEEDDHGDFIERPFIITSLPWLIHNIVAFDYTSWEQYNEDILRSLEEEDIDLEDYL